MSEKSQELVAQVPSDRAIVKRYGEWIAKSPKDIKRGEAVFLDKNGVAFGRGRYQRFVSVWKLVIYGSLVGSGVLMLSGAWIPGILLYSTGLLPTVLAHYRGTAKLMPIDVLARQGQLDEARRRLGELGHLKKRNPLLYGWLAGNLASHAGEYETALREWRAAIPRTDGMSRIMLELQCVKALLLLGKLEEARRTFDGITLPLEADEVLTSSLLVRVMFALHDALPDDEQLHDWARKALEYSHTGVELAAIGWAFERRGDAEMADMLATEAAERMHYPYLKTWWPALQQWLDGKSQPAPDPGD